MDLYGISIYQNELFNPPFSSKYDRYQEYNIFLPQLVKVEMNLTIRIGTTSLLLY
jgi:hypothetical protein